MIDLFETNGFMKSGVPIRVSYTRSAPDFYMVHDKDTEMHTYRFEITKILLLIPVIKVTESLLPEIERLCDIQPF